MANTYLARQKLKRGDYADLVSDDKTYQDGEPVIVQDVDRLALGDGATAFTDLSLSPLIETKLTPSADTTYTAADFRSGIVTILVTAGSGSDITITLPNPATLFDDSQIRIVKADAGTANVILAVTGGGNFNGRTGIVLADRYNNIKLYPNGSNYLVVDANISYTYDWTNRTNWVNQQITITHNLNFPLNLLDVRIFLSATGSNTNSKEYHPVTNIYDALTPANVNYIGALQPENVNSNVIQLQTGNVGVVYSSSTGTQTILGAASSHYLKVLVRAKFP